MSPHLWVATATAWLVAQSCLSGCDDPDGAEIQPAPSPLVGQGETCRTVGRPEHRARYSVAEAELRVTGYPFTAGDGPKALAWLGEAVVCHRAAGAPEQAARTAKQREKLKERLEDDYRILRLRLALSLAQGRKRNAAEEVRALRALLSSIPADGYTRWLQRLQRSLP